MQVPPGTTEYERSVRKAKELLVRLHKGTNMLNKAYQDNDTVQMQNIIRTWMKVSKELYTELEISTLIHQQFMTGNKVVLRGDGSLASVSDMVDPETVELDPWLLISMEKLKEVFGDDIHQFLEIKENDEPPN